MFKFDSIFALAKQITARQTDPREYIRREGIIGGKLFGPIAPGHHREFFCLDDRTWVWHEEWLDNANVKQSKTTRYEVHHDKVIKIQNGEYYKVEAEEALNLYKAVKIYCRKVKAELYTQAA